LPLNRHNLASHGHHSVLGDKEKVVAASWRMCFGRDPCVSHLSETFWTFGRPRDNQFHCREIRKRGQDRDREEGGTERQRPRERRERETERETERERQGEEREEGDRRF
jgi:hypothetical protein